MKPAIRRCVTAAAPAILVAAAAMPGCSGTHRETRTKEQLLEVRAEADKQLQQDFRTIFVKSIQHAKGEQEAFAAGKRSTEPIIEVLMISGGGDWGAFGAGFLNGWKSIPATDPLAMPHFDAVSGVSTGALIAPFAFIGTDESLKTVEDLYRNPKPDWVKPRGLLYFLPNNLSFAEVPGLERELRHTLTLEMVAKIAEGGQTGRMLVVNTTNLDDAGPRVFDLVTEAQRAVKEQNVDRIQNIMLASAGIPGAFPYREIDGQMYVDGGVTSNIIYGGRLGEEETLPAVWQKTYPDAPLPKLRYWVIFNNQLRALPATIEPRWPAIVTRSLELSVRSATLTAMRHLFAMAEISRLKRRANVEVRIVSIPDDWSPPVPGTFVKETMNNLADLGRKMGADPSSWRTTSP